MSIPQMVKDRAMVTIDARLEPHFSVTSFFLFYFMILLFYFNTSDRKSYGPIIFLHAYFQPMGESQLKYLSNSPAPVIAEE